MWKVFPHLLFLVNGDENDPDGGFGFEYISQIAVSIQNFISKDPNTFLQIAEGRGKTHIEMTFGFIMRALKINETSEHMLDGVVVMKVLIAMLENLKGRIDEALQYILKICIGQLQLEKKPPKNFTSMVIQTIAMAFWYNSHLTFHLLEESQATVLVFQKLL